MNIQVLHKYRSKRTNFLSEFEYAIGLVDKKKVVLYRNKRERNYNISQIFTVNSFGEVVETFNQ